MTNNIVKLSHAINYSIWGQINKFKRLNYIGFRVEHHESVENCFWHVVQGNFSFFVVVTWICEWKLPKLITWSFWIRVKWMFGLFYGIFKECIVVLSESPNGATFTVKIVVELFPYSCIFSKWNLIWHLTLWYCLGMQIEAQPKVWAQVAVRTMYRDDFGILDASLTFHAI